MEVKPGYKQTEIGVFPEEWDVEKLRELVTIRSGDSPSNYMLKITGIPFFKVDQLNNSNKYQKDTPYYIDVKNPIPAGSIVFPKRGAAIFMNKIRILNQDSYFDTNIMSVTPNHRIYTELLYYILTFIDISVLADTTSVPQINNKHIYPYSIAYPPDLKEQKIISNYLSDIDSLITSQEKLIDKKKLIKQGVMQELLTGKRRLPGFSGEWETKRLGDVSIVIMGQSPDSKYYNIDSKGIPLIQGNADIQNGKSVSRIWTLSITKECQKGDILITVRAPVGSVGISSGRSCLGRGVCAIKPHSIHDKFLYWQLRFSEDKWNESQQGSTFTSVNSNQINDFCILCPTRLDEQESIADVIEDIEIEIDMLGKNLQKQVLLKQAMMQELLTGRIRLV